MNSAQLLEAANARGHRWAITWTYGNGGQDITYLATADLAEVAHEDARRRYRNVKMWTPQDGVDLAVLGQARAEALRLLKERTEILRAGVLRALSEEGRTEAEVARTAGVDRMTVRSWAGK